MLCLVCGLRRVVEKGLDMLSKDGREEGQEGEIVWFGKTATFMCLFQNFDYVTSFILYAFACYDCDVLCVSSEHVIANE